MTVNSDEESSQNAIEPVERKRCFFDVKIGILPAGRIVFELYNDVLPKTCENFKSLCTGEKGIGKTTEKALYYKNVIFHRVVKDFMVQAGDFSNNNGTGGESIYGGTFDDEGFQFKHDKPFLLSMANRGKNTNGSQFFITTQQASHLDEIHVVFGHVVSGHDIVRQIENLPVDRNSRPLQDVVIGNCGELVKQVKIKKAKKKKKKVLSQSEHDSESSKEEDKKKKSRKKKKKTKSEESERKSGSEEGELKETKPHPMVSVTKIDKDEIPEVSHKYLMRGGNERDNKNDRRSRDRRDKSSSEQDKRFGWSKKKVPTSRSGRIIKGRGSFRYRTPSRSKSRSKSTTPPHWRNAQRRTIKLSDLQKIEEEKRTREAEIRRREMERKKRHEKAEEMARQGAKKSFYELTSSVSDIVEDSNRHPIARTFSLEENKKDLGKDLDLNALDYEDNQDEEWEIGPTKKQSAVTVVRAEVHQKSAFDAKIRDKGRRDTFETKRRRTSRSRSRGRRSPLHRGRSPVYRNRSPYKQRSPRRNSRNRTQSGRYDRRNRSRSYNRRSRSRDRRRKDSSKRSYSRDRSRDRRRSRTPKSRRSRSSSYRKRSATPKKEKDQQNINILPDTVPRDPSPKNIPLPNDSPPPMPARTLTEEEKARIKKEKMLKRAETLLLLKSHMEKEIAEQRRREKEKEKAKEEQLKVTLELEQLEKLKRDTLEKLKQHDELITVKKVLDVVTGTDAKKKFKQRSRSSSSSSSSSNSNRDKSKKRKQADKKKKRKRSRS